MDKSITNRQKQIIETAGKIISEKGLSSLTIKNLALEMKFSESALYRHFKSKEDIIVTMLEYFSEVMNTTFSEVTKRNITIEEKFKEVFKSQFKFFTDYPYFVSAIFPEGLLDESNRINETIIKVMETKSKYLFPLIKQGQDEGVFVKSVAPDQLMHIVMGSFRLLMFKWRLKKFKTILTKEGEAMLASLLIIIKNDKI